VPVDKIGEVIGPKGKMINQIQDDTGADISIEDDGTVYIGAVDGPSAEAARAAINAIANPQMPEVGERFMGTVVKTTTFGAFISLLPGKDGLLHISEVRKLVGGKRIECRRRRSQGRPEGPGRAQGDRPARQALAGRGPARGRGRQGRHAGTGRRLRRGEARSWRGGIREILYAAPLAFACPAGPAHPPPTAPRLTLRALGSACPARKVNLGGGSGGTGDPETEGGGGRAGRRGGRGPGKGRAKGRARGDFGS
jgi:hypothetical protein